MGEGKLTEVSSDMLAHLAASGQNKQVISSGLGNC